MLLTETEVRHSIDRVRAAFPHFRDWQHNNEINDSYSGFSLWAEYVHEPDDSMGRIFFITFDTHEASWRGHLSIGQHCYFWSSADSGDALLLDTHSCSTLEEAIATLNALIADLFAALSGQTLSE